MSNVTRSYQLHGAKSSILNKIKQLLNDDIHIHRHDGHKGIRYNRGGHIRVHNHIHGHIHKCCVHNKHQQQAQHQRTSCRSIHGGHIHVHNHIHVHVHTRGHVRIHGGHIQGHVHNHSKHQQPSCHNIRVHIHGGHILQHDHIHGHNIHRDHGHIHIHGGHSRHWHQHWLQPHRQQRRTDRGQQQQWISSF